MQQIRKGICIIYALTVFDGVNKFRYLHNMAHNEGCINTTINDGRLIGNRAYDANSSTGVVLNNQFCI